MDEILKERITSLKTGREAAVAALDRARLATHPADHVSPLSGQRLEAQAGERKLLALCECLGVDYGPPIAVAEVVTLHGKTEQMK